MNIDIFIHARSVSRKMGDLDYYEYLNDTNYLELTSNSISTLIINNLTDSTSNVRGYILSRNKYAARSLLVTILKYLS